MNENEYRRKISELTPCLYRVARSILKNDSDAADCVQEAVFRGWLKRRQLKSIEKFKPWITSIVISEARNLQRREGRRREAQKNASPQIREAHSCLPEALHALSETHRLPLVLFYLEGYSTREIAQILSIKEGAVRERLRSARIKLRRLIENDGV